MQEDAIYIDDYEPSYFEDWFAMTSLLFPNVKKEELREDLEGIEQNSKYRTFLAKQNTRPIGFVTLSVRTDYVEGARSSPVGYLEAIYVEESFRKTGIARLLYEQGETWLRDQNCTEIG